jgi:hypothetical protein
MKQTSQRSLLFRQNVNRTEAEWVHFLDGYRKAIIEFDMKKFGDDWHTAEDIVEEIFVNIVREPRITALRPQDSFRHVLINMCMQNKPAKSDLFRIDLVTDMHVAIVFHGAYYTPSNEELYSARKALREKIHLFNLHFRDGLWYNIAVS